LKKQILDTDSYSPLYRQLMHKLRSDIASGVYPVHSRIPSEQELCQTYAVSRVTVRKALLELTQEGLLKRHQGKGTFVSVPRLCKDLKDVNSFHDACSLLHVIPGTRVIHAQLTRANQEDHDKLLCDDDQVLEIMRLRTADDLPVMIETNRFPLAYSWLLEENLTCSLYSILQERHLEPKQGIHEISLCYATPQQAKLLAIEPNMALMQLNEIIYDQYSRPMHTSHQVIRGDRFTFRI